MKLHGDVNQGVRRWERRGALAAGLAAVAVWLGAGAFLFPKTLDFFTALLAALLLVNVAVGMVLLIAAVASHIVEWSRFSDSPPPRDGRPVLVRPHHELGS